VNRREGHELIPADAGTLADDLQSAKPRQLVYVDRQGRVQSARRYRTMNRLGYGMIFAVSSGALVLYGMALGLGGVAIAAGAVGVGVLPWIHYRRLSRGVAHLVRDELDQAEALFQKVAGGSLASRQMRACALHNLGAVATRRQQFETALDWQQRARALFRRIRRKPVHAHMADLATVHSLIELGRLDGAEALLAEIRETLPEGEYLQVQRWSAEVYLAMVGGSHQLSDDELHVRARTALQITSAVGLLLLLSWAYWKSGDADQAGHLMGQAFDRPEGLHLVETTMPRLWSWVREHEALAQSIEA